MHRCGPIEGVRNEENWDVDRGRKVSAGPQRGKGEGIMNENVDSMMIRLVGLALAVLMMAGMTIYTGLFLFAARQTPFCRGPHPSFPLRTPSIGPQRCISQDIPKKKA